MILQVLVVDDDPIGVFLHKAIVVKAGLSEDPLSFTNGSTTLEFIRQHYQEGNHFLVLLDINMPIMNGWQLLEALQVEGFNERIHVVVVTSSINLADREKARTYEHVFEYIEKPITLEKCKEMMKINELKEFYA